MKDKHIQYLQAAIEIAKEGIESGGGPFGAVVVRGGQVIGSSHNMVALHSDPTAHAEIEAIRQACRALQSPHLEGAVLYSSTEPCPMCLAAAYWAHLDKLYYASSRKDAKRGGFDDAFIYEELERPEATRRLKTKHIPSDDACAVFDLWLAKADRTEY